MLPVPLSTALETKSFQPKLLDWPEGSGRGLYTYGLWMPADRVPTPLGTDHGYPSNLGWSRSLHEVQIRADDGKAAFEEARRRLEEAWINYCEG